MTDIKKMTVEELLNRMTKSEKDKLETALLHIDEAGLLEDGLLKKLYEAVKEPEMVFILSVQCDDTEADPELYAFSNFADAVGKVIALERAEGEEAAQIAGWLQETYDYVDDDNCYTYSIKKVPVHR